MGLINTKMAKRIHEMASVHIALNLQRYGKHLDLVLNEYGS